MNTFNDKVPQTSFVDRLIDEKKQLQDKIDKLENFISGDEFKKVEENQQSLLRIQLYTMKLYSHVLLERITKLT